MPIRQPTKTTIRSNDFTNHTFSFPVESVLKPKQGTGKLVISASPGYLLTTSPDAEPASEQTLDHVLQPDGNRVASGIVTLLASNDPQADSTITIRNPSGETVILTVDVTPDTAPVVQAPALQVSVYELAFPKTTPGNPTFLVFSLAQQNAETPVTITTDAPDLFQFASDNRPGFAPGLTLIPSAEGTYVHVRYEPTGVARTEALLTIETPYVTKYIDLTSPRASWLPIVRTPMAVRPAYAHPVAKPVSATRWLWLSQLLVVGLAIAGYQFRCQLMPSLCQEVSKPDLSASSPVSTSSAPMPDTNRLMAIKTKPVLLNPARKGKGTPQPKNDTTQVSAAEVIESPVAQKPAPEPVVEPTAPPVSTVRPQPARRVPPRQSTDSSGTNQPRRSPVANPSAESELEKELNKKPADK